jgi:hypothetical protein
MVQAADFFVSYTSADRTWAEWIAWQLEQAGHQVIIQGVGLRAGRQLRGPHARRPPAGRPYPGPGFGSLSGLAVLC